MLLLKPFLVFVSLIFIVIMIWFIIRTIFVATTIVLLLKHDHIHIRKWVKQTLHEKYGISQVHEFGLSYQRHGRQTPLIIRIYGMRICRDHIINISSRSVIPRFVLDKIPVHLFFARLAASAALFIDQLVLEKDNVTIVFNQVYIQSELKQKEEFAIKIKSGPLHLTANDAAGEVTTDSFATFSCPFRSKRLLLEHTDLDVRIGKPVFGKNESIHLFSTNAALWVEDLNSVRVTVDSQEDS